MLEVVLKEKVQSNSHYLPLEVSFRLISRHVTIAAILTANGGKNFTNFDQSFLAEAKVKAGIVFRKTEKYTSEPRTRKIVQNIVETARIQHSPLFAFPTRSYDTRYANFSTKLAWNRLIKFPAPRKTFVRNKVIKSHFLV